MSRLAAQNVPADFPWEVLIVDNASTDDTVEVAERCWPHPAPAPLRIVHESRLGVGNARLRSVSEARGEIISFIDDDNWIGPDWLEKVATFFAKHPDVVAVGGASRAAFEAPPPAWLEEISGSYALGEPYAEAGDITNHTGTLLWGAGMSFRRKKAVELVARGFQNLLCGGNELSIKTGEDAELCFGLRALGGRIFYEPALAIEHFMPASRLTWSNALRLMRNMGEASPVLDLYAVALDVPPFRGRPAWRNSWLFFYFKALRDFAGTFAGNPSACMKKPEGSMPALAFELNKGKLATLVALFGRFERLKRCIRQSDWARLAGR